MNLLYNLGTQAYFLGIKAAAALGHRKAKLMEEGRKDWAPKLEARMTTLRQETPDRPWIWFHAASLGEFEQGRPLIEALREKYPHYRILQTFFSPSGYEVRKGYKGADVVCYLPYDRPSECRRFLDITRPELVFFVKYEFWGNILSTLKAKQIETYLISGIFRKEQTFFKWYGGTFRKMLKCFKGIYVQNEESQQLLSTIGIASTISGDTRFDRVCDIAERGLTPT